MLKSSTKELRSVRTGTALALAMALCAGPALAAEYTMKIAFSDPRLPDDVEQYTQTPLRAYEKEIEEATNGAIDVQIYWNNELGKLENVVNFVRNGLVEAVIASDGQLAPYFPDAQVWGIPYLFLSRDVAYRVIDGDFGDYYADKMAKEAGLRPMPWLENGGYRHYSSNSPMKTAEDMKGLKIRTMNNPIHMEIVRSLGASPTPIPWGDVYTSLQTGVVDGQENALSTFIVPKLEEVQKNIILDGHVYSINGLILSEKWYESLPPEYQKVLQEAGEHFKKTNRELSIKNEQRDRDYLEKAGVTIVDPTPEAKHEFQELTQGPAMAALEGEVDPETLTRLMEAVKEAEAAVATGN